MRNKFKKGDVIYCSRRRLLGYCECIAKVISSEDSYYRVLPLCAHSCENIYYKSAASCAEHAIKVEVTAKFIEYFRLFREMKKI